MFVSLPLSVSPSDTHTDTHARLESKMFWIDLVSGTIVHNELSH